MKIDPQHVASWINWGRLLHEQGETGDADRIYRLAIDKCGPDPLLMFNRGVLLEDLGKTVPRYHYVVGLEIAMYDA